LLSSSSLSTSSLRIRSYDRSTGSSTSSSSAFFQFPVSFFTPKVIQ
jgi:hypothetical protein